MIKIFLFAIIAGLILGNIGGMLLALFFAVILGIVAHWKEVKNII